MDKNYMEYLAKLDLITYHYKLLLLLNIKPYNQSQLADQLQIQKQNVHKYIKTLEAMGLIEVDRVEGRNKFYKAVTNMKVLHEVVPGQFKIMTE